MFNLHDVVRIKPTAIKWSNGVPIFDEFRNRDMWVHTPDDEKTDGTIVISFGKNESAEGRINIEDVEFIRKG